MKYCQVMYVRNGLLKCCPGNVGMCLLCEMKCELLRHIVMCQCIHVRNIFLNVVL